MRALLAVFVLWGCAGSPDETGDSGDPPVVEQEPPPADWCAVTSVFRSRCTLCHGPGNLQGELDLATEPYGAVVGVESATFGGVLVAPGDPDGSLLYRKMTGTQAPEEGEDMPPAGLVPSAADTVGRWIAEGATEACDST